MLCTWCLTAVSCLIVIYCRCTSHTGSSVSLWTLLLKRAIAEASDGIIGVRSRCGCWSMWLWEFSHPGCYGFAETPHSRERGTAVWQNHPQTRLHSAQVFSLIQFVLSWYDRCGREGIKNLLTESVLSPNSSHWTRSSLSMCLATSFNGSKSEESEEREYLLWQAADDCVVSTIALLFFAVLIRRTLRSYIDLLDQLNFPKLVQLGLFAFVV